MTWKQRISWTALGLAILMMVAASGGYLYLRSAWFQNFALRKIEAAADSATGGKTTVGRLDFSLSALTANLYDITLRGQEGGDQPPLVHADKLTVRIKIQSIFDAKVSLRELLIDHPVVHIQVRSRSLLSVAPRTPCRSSGGAPSSEPRGSEQSAHAAAQQEQQPHQCF